MRESRVMGARMPEAPWLTVAAMSLVLVACTAPTPSPTTSSPSSSSAVPVASPLGAFAGDAVDGLRTEVDIPYTDAVDCGGSPCRVPGDVIAPDGAATLPTVVLLNGGGKLFTERRYQAPLAAELARRGAVVFLIAYRGLSTGSYSDDDSWDDARCAIRYARAHTAEYGGDPSRVVVVGHSQGGLMGLDIAIHPEEEAEGCVAEGSALPDGVIALGTPRPSLFDAAASGPPLWLFSGSEDRPADDFAQLLRDAGFDAESVILPGVTHDGITDPEAAPEIVDLIVEALASV